MGIAMSCCPSSAAPLTSQVFQEGLNGDRRKMNDRPEVWVTITQVVFPEGPLITFSQHAFDLANLQLNATFEITGTNSQIMKEIGAEAAIKLMDKMTVVRSTSLVNELTGSTGKPKPVVSSNSLVDLNSKKPEASKVADKFEMGKRKWDARETKVFVLHSILSIARESGCNGVRVTVSRLEAEDAQDECAARVPLQGEELRKYIEDACSQRTLEVIVAHEGGPVDAKG